MEQKLNKIIKLLEEINQKLTPGFSATVYYPYCQTCGAYMQDNSRCWICEPWGSRQGEITSGI